MIALGGNAMTTPEGRARPEDQIAAIAQAAEPIADVVATGAEVVLTHGNGPQVGNLLVKNELAAAVVPPVPLDWCGAQTQGTIGAMLINAVEAALAGRGLNPDVAAVVTRTLVDQADPGFTHPTKPIGRYLPAGEAAVMISHGQLWEDRGERGWRRIVASPEPREVLDAGAVIALLAAGFVVVAAGGGGIPVVRAGVGARGWHGIGDDEPVRGVEAVIDKDLTAAVLARAVGAEVLIIATDVPAVMLDWGRPGAHALGRVTAGELRGYAAEGQFAGGSMGPKVEAACRFVEAGGAHAAICSLARIADAAAGTAGTIVTAATIVTTAER
jgi:carbamate kinase